MSKYILLKRGEFAYNKSYSSGFDFGSIKRLDGHEEGALSSLYICFSIKNVNSDFMVQYFDSLQWYRDMKHICGEGARNHGLLNCSPNDFFGIKVHIPESNYEQQRIANLFSALDKKIDLAERKLKKTHELRDSLLEGLLGQTIRFVDSSGKHFPDWQSVTLTEASTSLSYGMNAAATVFDGKHRYIRITDIDDETREYLSKNAVSPDKVPESKYKLEVGDILFARTGNSVGKSYIYKPEDGDLYYAGFLIRARIKKEVNPYFVYLNTLTKQFSKWVSISSQRSGQPGINSEQYGSYGLKLPCRIEQDKIADFMINIESKILTMKRKVSTLRQMKAALLQQMFV